MMEQGEKINNMNEKFVKAIERLEHLEKGRTWWKENTMKARERIKELDFELGVFKVSNEKRRKRIEKLENWNKILERQFTPKDLEHLKQLNEQSKEDKK